MAISAISQRFATKQAVDTGITANPVTTPSTGPIPDAIQKLMQDNAASTSTGPKNELGKDDFLKLMLTELKYQDPMNAKSDKEFIAQLAQFSSLEQTTKLADTMGAAQQFNQLAQMSSLVGKSVVINDPDTSQTATGPITEARLVDGKVQIGFNGKMYDTTVIVAITDPIGAKAAGGTAPATTTTPSGSTSGGSASSPN